MAGRQFDGRLYIYYVGFILKVDNNFIIDEIVAHMPPAGCGCNHTHNYSQCVADKNSVVGGDLTF